MFDQEAVEFVKLLNACLKQNLFLFNDYNFLSRRGLAMASPLSPLLADIFMDTFESATIFDNNGNPYAHNVIYYYRYVDDILEFGTGTVEELNSCLEHINSIPTKSNLASK